MRDERTKGNLENEKKDKPSLARDSKSDSVSDTNKNRKLLVIIRISGMVKVNKDIENTLNRLRLRRKYSCVLIDSNNKSLKGMLKKIKYYIAYGPVNEKVLIKLIKERGKSVKGNKKKLNINIEKIVKELMNGKKLNEFGLKGFFRLHPPRKGIKSKLQYSKGVLGNNGKDINKLIERML